MTTITQDVVIPADHRLTVELPPHCHPGIAKITLTIESKVGKAINRIASLRGKGKGKVWMSEDFDAPLEDFVDYM